MNYRVSHTTKYCYAEPVSVCQNELRLTPRNRPGQTTLRAQLLVEPTPSTLRGDVDYFGNAVTFLTLQEPHAELTITAKSHVDVVPIARPAEGDTPAWEAVAARVRAADTADLLAAAEFAFASPQVGIEEGLRAYAAPSFPAGRPLLAAALELTHRIHAEFAYDPEATTVATPVATVLAERRGVCQDFAHLEIGCLRALGLPARYVSGYIQTVPSGAGERLVGADASHAWLSVYLPDHGWTDLDPTNDQVPSGRHVTLAWGRDYGDVAPIKGVVLGGGEHTMHVAVDVRPLA
jgi:transglutaminase-like putative cysteine protease